MHDLIFYIFLFTGIIGSVMCLVSRNLIHNTFWLLLVLLCVAAFFVYAGAEFVALSQILIYAAGVIILLVFGIMLSSRYTGKIIGHFTWGNILQGLFMAAAFACLLVFMIRRAGLSYENVAEPMSVSQIGFLLISHYAIPFELAGLLLLVVIIASSSIIGKIDESVWSRK